MERDVGVHQRAVLVQPRRRVFVAQAEVEGHIGADLPRVGEVIRLAQRAELRHRERHRRFVLLGVAEQEIGECVSRRDGLKLEIPARKLVAHLVVHVVADAAAGLEGMAAANPRHVVVELEGAIAIGVRPFGVVAEAAESGDPDRRNPPGLGWIQRDARDGELLDDIALERQLPSERVEEVVEAEAELVHERRRHRPGVAERDLMNPRVQLGAVQLQRRRNLILFPVAVSPHPRRGRALHQVHALRVLGLVDDTVLQRQVVVRKSAGGAIVGLGIELEQLLRNRIDAGRGNDVSGERRAHARRPAHGALRGIDDHVGRPSRLRVDRAEVAQQLREVSAPHRRRRHAVKILELLPIAVALEVRHEEQMVPPRRTAGSVAVLGPLERRLRRSGLRGRERVRPGVPGVVAVEFEAGAVEAVGARFRDHVHLARLAAEFRGVDAGLDLELLERVDRGEKDVGVEVDVGVVDAVERVEVELAALARNRQLLGGARAALPGARLPGAGELGADVRAERDELEIVPAVQRQFDDAPVLDHRADGGIRRLDQRRDADDRRLFGDRAQLHREVDARRLLHLQFNVAVQGFEPHQLGGDRVGAGRQRGKIVQADLVARRGPRRSPRAGAGSAHPSGRPEIAAAHRRRP